MVFLVPEENTMTFGEYGNRSTAVLMFGVLLGIGFILTLLAYTIDIVLMLIFVAVLVVSTFVLQEVADPPRKGLVPVALGSMFLGILILAYRIVVRGDSLLFAMQVPPSNNWFAAASFFWIYAWTTLAVVVIIWVKKGAQKGGSFGDAGWSNDGKIYSIAVTSALLLVFFVLVMFSDFFGAGDAGFSDRWNALILLIRNFFINIGISLVDKGTVFGSVKADANKGILVWMVMVLIPIVLAILLIMVSAGIGIDWARNKDNDTLSLMRYTAAAYIISAILLSLMVTAVT